MLKMTRHFLMEERSSTILMEAAVRIISHASSVEETASDQLRFLPVTQSPRKMMI